MRISDCRYDRDRLRLAVAFRLIAHEARTQTIRHCTGLSGDRIRKLYRHYMQGLPGAACPSSTRQVATPDVLLQQVRGTRAAGGHAGLHALLLRASRTGRSACPAPRSRKSRGSATCTRRSCASVPPPPSASSTPGTLDRCSVTATSTCWQAAQTAAHCGSGTRSRCFPDVCAAAGCRCCPTCRRRIARLRVPPGSHALASPERIRRTVPRPRRSPAQGRGLRRGRRDGPAEPARTGVALTQPGAPGCRRLVGRARRGAARVSPLREGR